MRYIRSFISFFILLILISSTVFAANNDIINVSMNGGKVSVREVPIIMNGQAISMDAPSFIHIDRTLVPLRFVAENFGAKVDWDQKTKTATVLFKEKQIEMTIDSPKVMINKAQYNVDKNSIPKLVIFANDDSRTMVPLAFISETLGFEVGYDEIKRIPYINYKEDDEVVELEPETDEDLPTTIGNIIENISIEKGGETEKIVIKSQDKLVYDSIFLPDSNKLVIDIKDAKLNLKNTGDGYVDISAKNDNFTRLEYSQYSTKPYVTRVVITLKDKLDYDITPSKDGKTTVISFVNKIKGISLDYIDGNQVIVIEGSKNSKFNVMKLKNPERIVIDIIDASFIQGEYFEYDYDLGFIKKIRASQFPGDNNYSPLDRIVRVVLDCKDGVIDPSAVINSIDGKLIIYPEKNFWDNIKYETIEKDRFFSIKTLYPTSYNINYDSAYKTMKITLPSGYDELNEGIVAVKDGLVDEIKVVKNPMETILEVKFIRSIEYEILSRDRDDVIKFSFRRDTNILPSDRLIVIDPGHGGTAPGATSITGVREKDLNIHISRKVESALKDKGYNVVMTRYNDETVGLYDRPGLANDLFADVFVSIHGNSTTSPSVSGIEVLYSPATSSNNKTEDQYPLARLVMDEILKATGGKERGVIKRPDLVVIREANMPAILVEVGFMSNPEEEKLILNDNYQNKIVEGIIKGIEKYFELY